MSNEINFINRDDLREYIHNIHNFLRNKGAGYGQTGLKIFNVFYGLKLIKEYLDTLGLNKKQKKALDFDELVKKSKKEVEIINYIDKEVLEELWQLKNNKDDKNNQLGSFIFHQIPRDLNDSVWKDLIEMIDKLPVGFKKDRKVNLSGKVWEYFIGRDKEAISELGAYFTDRHITDFIFKRLNIPLKKNKEIENMIDPFGGSGGFTLGYANYLRENFEVDWKQNVDKIYHFDMEESVINMTGLEMFAITGYFPERNDNYIRVNSFTYEFNKKYNNVITNPPYGGDKISKNTEQLKKEKIISYIKSLEEKTDVIQKQLKILNTDIKNYKKELEKNQVNTDSCSKRIKNFAKLYKLEKCNDKEACSLILIMDLLEKDGRACAVLKEGVFFDSKYSDLRKVLIENYNITDIISVPQTAFENTSTKTSIIIFYNNGPTKEVNFSQLNIHLEEEDIFDLDTNGLVQLSKNKGEFKDISEEFFCKVDVKQIIENPKKYSLNYKDYKDFTIDCPKGYILKSLKDICVVNPESEKIKLEDIEYVQISDMINNRIENRQKMKFKEAPKGTKRHPKINDIILASVRPNVKKVVLITEENYSENLMISGAILVLRCNKKEDAMIVYEYILKNLDNYLRQKAKGSSYPRIDPDSINEIQIPFLKK